MKIAIVGNYSRNLIVFRSGLISQLIAIGHGVVCAAPENDGAVRRNLERLGARFRVIQMDRAAVNIFAELRYLVGLIRELSRERPDVVMTFTHKPNVYGAIACQLLGGVPHVFMIEGLGYSFINVKGLRKVCANLFIRVLYYLAFRSSSAAIFLNRDDLTLFRQLQLLAPDKPVIIMPGIGVDLNRFRYVPPPTVSMVFLMVARCLYTKGVLEYCEACRIVAARHPEVRFELLGSPDPSDDGVPTRTLDRYAQSGVITLHKQTDNPELLYARCSVYVLPSYREGFPVTIMEAMATGRPVITTDVPGCRDAVEHGVSGVLVPPKDVSSLVAAMLGFIQHPVRVTTMGLNSRRIAEARFDRNAISIRQVEIVHTVFANQNPCQAY